MGKNITVTTHVLKARIVRTEKLVFIYLVLAQQVQTVWSIRRMKF